MVKLTQFSHGAGCGCKLSPQVLDTILHGLQATPDHRLLVGNDARDDAAAYDLGNGQALISTTDFFMPIVDDPETFGRIAAANAISDVYAMGATPVVAIGILGWPVDKLSPEIAGQVVRGGHAICQEAGIALAGGHSIDSPEPIFGLSVNGIVPVEHLKRNAGAKPGDLLYLTKPLGVGILTTAEKKGLLKPEHEGLAAQWMTRLNKVGAALASVHGVHALTDVTGFGLMGHLVEMAEASGLNAQINFEDLPRLSQVAEYIEGGAIPGGTQRNFASYGHKLGPLSDAQRALVCDPQTSGGLLIAADPQCDVATVLAEAGLGDFAEPIGALTTAGEHRVMVQ